MARIFIYDERELAPRKQGYTDHEPPGGVRPSVGPA